MLKKLLALILALSMSSICLALNITDSYYVDVVSVEPVVKTIKRYDSAQTKTCKDGNKIKECDPGVQKNFVDKIIGYDVTFEIDGNIFVTRMKRDPGKVIKIKEVRRFIPLEENR